MRLRTMMRTLVETTGYSIHKKEAAVYDEDGLQTIHNHDFVTDASFRKDIRTEGAAAADYHWHWRTHIGLWAAYSASKLGGDFVECGVNRGFLSSAIMDFLNWDSLEATFYLLDTFEGLDDRYVSEKERQRGALSKNQRSLNSGFYVRGVDAVKANFSEMEERSDHPGAGSGHAG